MDWQTFLDAQGISHVDKAANSLNDQAGFGALALGAAVIPLQDYGLIRFSGEETINFVHGQVSSDVKKLPSQGAQYSSYSTPKGRMLASMLLMRDGEQLDLMLPRTLLAATQKRLSMFVMRSKTKASDVSDSVVLLGLLGPKAIAIANQVLGRIPEETMGSSVSDSIQLVRLSGDRLLLILPVTQAIAIWPHLIQAGAIPAAQSLWTLSDIQQGIVWVQAETQEAFVAQMANMELIGAVSFKKGCYPGQEIVARTQYLGKLKRRAMRISSSVQLTVGESVYSPEMNGQASGTIAMAAPSGPNSWEGLIVVQTASVEHGLHLEHPEGALLSVLPLPYALETT